MSVVIENIHKSFGKNYVLQGIDFAFETGQLNVIIGASGSGKSVLVKCMLALMKPDEGRVFFDDRNILTMKRPQLRELRKEIGMLFQSSALFDSMTVYQNVSFPLKMFTRMNREDVRERVAKCLEQVSLGGTEELHPAELSGGMRKRVGLARAIVMNPTFLICDEPNSGLDPQTAEQIDELIAHITYEFQTTTIVITHDMRSVLNYADKVLFLHQGHKEWEGSREAIPFATNKVLREFIETSGLLNSDLMQKAAQDAEASSTPTPAEDEHAGQS